MSSARNKKVPRYDDYISYSELVSMLNTCASMFRATSWNYRVFATSVHLVLEVALKKTAILYGVSVSTTSHNTGALITSLRDKDALASSLFRGMIADGTFRLLQRFPYDQLRFDSAVSEDLIDPMLLWRVTGEVLKRLEYLESSLAR